MLSIRGLRGRYRRVMNPTYAYRPWLAFFGVYRLKGDYIERTAKMYAANVRASNCQPLDNRHRDESYWLAKLRGDSRLTGKG